MLDHDRIRKTLAQIGLPLEKLKIESLPGDASNRRYHRLHLNGSGVPASLILMELADPEGFKKSEEKVLRSDIPVFELPFINILNHLTQAGVAVPKLYHYREKSGWIFLQDLGDETMDKRLKNNSWQVNQDVYRMALDELVKIQLNATRQHSSECIAFGRPFDAPLLMWEIKKIGGPGREKKIVVSTHPEVASLLYDEERKGLEELEREFHKKIIVKADSSLHIEQYDVVTL